MNEFGVIEFLRIGFLSGRRGVINLRKKNNSLSVPLTALF